MSVGQLLQKYRRQQKKTQKEWCQGIISPSFYGKVEKDRNKIAVQDLLKLLNKNNIPANDFFASLSPKPAAPNSNLQEDELGRLITEAYYNKSAKELQQLRHAIAQSSLPNKDDSLLFLDGYLALISGNLENLTAAKRKKLKDKIFSIKDFTKDQLSIYTSFMMFYDVDSNLLLVRKIIKKYKNSADSTIKAAFLIIIFNLLILCIMNNRYQETQFFIDFAKQIPTTPALFFYKNGLLLLENMIYYHTEPKEKYFNTCQTAINNFALLGMPSYAEKMRNFFNGYINCAKK